MKSSIVRVRKTSFGVVATLITAMLLISPTGPEVAGAQDVPPQALKAKINAFVQYRNSLVVAGDARLARPQGLGGPARATLEMAEQSLTKYRGLMAEMGEEYGRPVTKIEILDTARNTDGRVEVTYHEVTSFPYIGPPDADLPEATAYGADYFATFAHDSNRLILESVELEGSGQGVAPLTQPVNPDIIPETAAALMSRLATADEALEGKVFGEFGGPDNVAPDSG